MTYNQNYLFKLSCENFYLDTIQNFLNDDFDFQYTVIILNVSNILKNIDLIEMFHSRHEEPHVVDDTSPQSKP